MPNPDRPLAVLVGIILWAIEPWASEKDPTRAHWKTMFLSTRIWGALSQAMNSGVSWPLPLHSQQ